MSLISSSRRPGGQPSNTNALKHGFYARKFKPRRLADYVRARAVTGLDEEIALLRLVILNLVESCLPAAGGPPDLAACSALEASLARLTHLLKDRRLLDLGDADPAEVLAALFASANASLPFTAIFPPAPVSPAPEPARLAQAGDGLQTAGGEGTPSLDGDGV